MIGFSLLGRHGRLGNQIFQYAALLGVAERRGFEVIVPPTGLHELGRTFRLSAAIGTVADFAALRFAFVDDRLGWWPDLDRVGDSTDIKGYFQSPDYFPREESLRSELVFFDHVAEPAVDAERRLRERFATLVGVTVRRGDYLVHTDKYVQVWADGYYERALTRLSGDGVGFVVSSDDPAWCRERFARADVVVLDGELSDASQLALLTRCDHAVIANSSYAWWSAWLIAAPTKVVIAPDRWYERHPGFNGVERPPLPAGWLAL